MSIFGEEKAASLINMLGGTHEEQMAWASSINTSRNTIEDSWRTAFRGLGSTPEFQAIENQHMQPYIDKAVEIANKYGFKSERGLALAFDIAVQNGGVRKTANQTIIDNIKNQEINLGRVLTEVEVMKIVANAVADASRQQFREDVRSRKMTIATGTGNVHGQRYNVYEDYGISRVRSWYPEPQN